MLIKKSKKIKKLTLLQNEWLIGLSFISIWILGYLIFGLFTTIYTLILSFNSVKITPIGIDTTYVGFDNYYRAFSIDQFFLNDLSSYFSEIIIYVPVIIVVALILAMLLNTKVKGKGFFKTLFFLPVIITSGPVIKQFLDQGVTSLTDVDKIFNFSMLYDVLPQIIAQSIDILVNEFVIILWCSGVQILIFIAGIQKIDKAMYEAAQIDGAGKWELFWKLTLPAINPIIIINVIYTVITQSLFSLNPIVIKILSEMNNVQTGYGYSAAIAWIYQIVLLFILVIFILLFKNRNGKVKKATI